MNAENEPTQTQQSTTSCDNLNYFKWSQASNGNNQSDEGRGRGRPRNDGLPNNSTKTAKTTNNKPTKRLKTPAINAAEMA